MYFGVWNWCFVGWFLLVWGRWLVSTFHGLGGLIISVCWLADCLVCIGGIWRLRCLLCFAGKVGLGFWIGSCLFYVVFKVVLT